MCSNIRANINKAVPPIIKVRMETITPTLLFFINSAILLNIFPPIINFNLNETCIIFLPYLPFFLLNAKQVLIKYNMKNPVLLINRTGFFRKRYVYRVYWQESNLFVTSALLLSCILHIISINALFIKIIYPSLIQFFYVHWCMECKCSVQYCIST